MADRIRRALVSVYDKGGVVELCRGLRELEIDIVSSGGTARLLGTNDVECTAVSDVTGHPEMLDGRVKTLHPKVHGGILAVRANARHMDDLRSAGIEPIDLVVVNLYPFAQTAAIEGVGLADVVEMIDVGGPTMVRAAAKNFGDVGIVVDPADYDSVLDELRRDGALSDDTRRSLATKAFRHTSSYDAAVCGFLAGGDENRFPENLEFGFVKAQELRYGENPHQRAAFYRDPLDATVSTASARQLQGKPLSFNNILDFDAALGLASELHAGAAVIVKHGNPCGAALGSEPSSAFARALACDPLSAFGGVIAFNRPVDGRAAAKIVEQFYEGVAAPGFDSEALAIFSKKKKLRLLDTGGASGRRSGFDLRRVHGGLLVQDWDVSGESIREGRVATARSPTEAEWRAMDFGWTVCKHVRSNAIVFAAEDRTIGVGAGQMSRVDSVKLGMEKAQSPLDGTAMASDAFFPFRDGIDTAAAAGVRAVVQPGGSIRDDEVVAAADEHGMTMVFTGTRHFRH